MKTTTKTRSSSSTSKTRSAGSTRKTTRGSKTDSAGLESTAATSQNHDEVAELAYFIYKDRIAHGIPGDEISDWHAAEAEILDRSEVGLAV